MAKEYIERKAVYQYLDNEVEWRTNQDRLFALEAVSDFPTADVAQVRHGKWIIHTEHFAPYQQCSVCGFEIPVIATENELDIGLYRYCPDCGCRMDLEG